VDAVRALAGRCSQASPPESAATAMMYAIAAGRRRIDHAPRRLTRLRLM
jgi:hypothetical protein